MEQVSLDLAKSVYSKYIDWDLQMYDTQTNTPAVAAKWVSVHIFHTATFINTFDGHFIL
jgi:hypothetical protein